MTGVMDWLARRAQLSPRKTALIEAASGRHIGYADWNRQANRTARFLKARAGIGVGDRVAVLAANSVEYLDLLFACQKLGAVLQNLNWRLAVPELAALLADAEPRVLLYSGEFVDQVSALRRQPATSSIRAYVALDTSAAADDTPFSDRDQHSAGDLPPAPVELADPWVICYTGGSTGLPKGVILSHGNLLWNACNTTLGWGIGADDTAILNAPLFHTGGLNVFTTPLVLAGGTSVVCQGFDPEQVFDLVAGGEVTLFFGVPTMFALLQEHPRWAAADFSRLKLVISGGAPCPQPVFQRFWDKGWTSRPATG